jgi:beta-phosphoglucomutase
MDTDRRTGNQKPRSAFIFDMDGTIVDSMPFHMQSWLKVWAEVSIPITAEDMHRNNRGTIVEVIRRIAGSHLSDAEVIAIAERKEVLFREMFRPHLKLIDGLQRFLDEARHIDVALALATCAGQENIAFVLDGLGIRSYFETVVGEEDVESGKPDPETFLTAAARLGVPPDRCTVFEDSHSGIEAAYHAGMRTVVVATTLDAHDVKGYPTVTHVIDDYTSLHPTHLVDGT